MTQDEIIAMAREAAADVGQTLKHEPSAEVIAFIVALTTKVEAKEREACAQVCEDVSLQAATSWKLAYQPQDQGRETGADDCAAAIRARGAA
jgi:hypothetical protein